MTISLPCWIRSAAFLMLGAIAFAPEPLFAEVPLPELRDIQVESSKDGTMQPSKIWVPESAESEPTPLLVFLHSWSGDYRQDNSKWQREAGRRNWIYLHPNFRGINNHPEACGSALARQDILDAVDFVCQTYNVDTHRIYLAGTSGGGHMAMLMAGYHPDRFSAVSAWVGISDLSAWHRFHTKDGRPQRYAQMVAKCCGGPPGSSPKVDREYRDRSPLFHLDKTGSLPVHFYAGLHDGHTGSVPVHHTIDAFNAIAKAGDHPRVSEEEIGQLLKDRPLENPQPGDLANVPGFGRKAYLQRKAGAARITIFEGGHEGLPGPACEWLAMQQRETKTAEPKPAAP